MLKSPLSKFFCVALSLFVVSACVDNDNPLQVNDEAERFNSLLKDDWQYYLKTSPGDASYLGDKRYSQHWADLSLAALAKSHQHRLGVVEKMNDINTQSLSDADKLNHELFLWMQNIEIAKHAFNPHLLPINQMEGIQTQDDFANFIAFDNAKDYQDWLVRLEKLPTLIDQNIALMEEGIKLGVTQPKDIVRRVPAQISKQIVKRAEESLFYKQFKTFPKSVSETEQKQLQLKARQVIADKIVPAYQKLHTFVTGVYLPASRETHGIWDLPNGKAYYELLVKEFTTTDKTPDEIHQIGLQEVARNRKAMDEVIAEVGFKGDFEAFVKFLREDPQFYYETPEQLYNGYLAISKKLDPEMTFLFGKLPRAPYGVKPIPDAIAPDTTTAYYYDPAPDGSRPGYYYVNLHAPETRPKYEMEVLSVHEAVPGHHLQLALQQELGELPEFRRYSGFTVFIEGWGLYSERLGYEMGLYKDPYSRFGQLTYDMWRAIRLVVDTGIHYKGWTRQQSIDYFKANAAKSEQDITNEIDRYIVWPGQALAYKMGQLKMLELRAKAERELGDTFDIRAFHDTMLGQGSVPLHVLENQINQWMSTQQSSH